jgi:hypothetical protein
MANWPKDTTAAKMAFYGDFRKDGFESAHLTRINPPFQMYYEKKPIASILVNKACAVAMMAAFTEIAEKCGHDQKKIDATGASDFGGCFNVRVIARSSTYSNHSWACAIDLSPSTNGFRQTKTTTLSNIVIDAFKGQGARWGGDYKGRKDPMHFEFVSPA